MSPALLVSVCVTCLAAPLSVSCVSSLVVPLPTLQPFLSLARSLTLSHTQTFSLSLSLPPLSSISLSLSLSLSHTHTHAHTLTLSPSVSVPFLFACFFWLKAHVIRCKSSEFLLIHHRCSKHSLPRVVYTVAYAVESLDVAYEVA